MANYPEYICKDINVAFIHPVHMFVGKNIKCAVMELKGFFSHEYGYNVVNQGFKYKEQMNVAFLKLHFIIITMMNTRCTGLRTKVSCLIMLNILSLGIYFSFLIEILIFKYKTSMI